MIKTVKRIRQLSFLYRAKYCMRFSLFYYISTTLKTEGIATLVIALKTEKNRVEHYLAPMYSKGV
jgi:hypothetical protein